MLGKIDYELVFQTEQAAVDLVSHISLLKKYVGDPTSIMHLESVLIQKSITYEDVQIEIRDCQAQRLRNQKSRFNQGFVEESVYRESYLGSSSNHLGRLSSPLDFGFD